MSFFKRRIGNGDDDDDDESVAEYFNKIDQCGKIPDAILFKESDEIQKLNLEIGKQIRIYKENDTNRNIDPDIYVITNINKDQNTQLITDINIISTLDNTVTKIIQLNSIYNIVNINPESLYIDKDFLDRITTTDTNNLKSVTKLKYELHKAIILFIRQKQHDINDVLQAFKEETFNIAKAEGKIKILKDEISDLPNKKDNTIYNLINNLKKIALDQITRTTDCYYIQYLDTALNYLSLSAETKDFLLNNYIFLCECLSATVIAGAIQVGFTRRTWIFNILYIFLERILNTPGINAYIITPAITLYLYTNMDTIYLSTNYLINGINELLSIILCSITSAIDAISIQNKNDTTLVVDYTSQESNITIATTSSKRTIITVTTFPSMRSIESLYNSQNVNDINDNDKEKTYSKALTNDLKIITQNNSVYSNNSSLSSYASQPLSRPPSQPPSRPPSPTPSDLEFQLKAGKIKNTRITKKYKRMTIRRSKRSKKMKGGKRTRSSKKRRVVRRRKHNTKKY